LPALIIVLGVWFLLPTTISAQTTNQHGTLLAWEHKIKRFVWDRSHNYGGSNFFRGLFRESIDPLMPEHDIDLVTYRFTPINDYQWTRSSQGYRVFLGSLDAKYLATVSHFKSSVSISDNSSFNVDGVLEETFRANRFLGILNYERTFASEHTAGVYHTLNKTKGDLDAGFYYQYGSSSDGMIRVETTFLDWPSNVTENLASSYSQRYNVIATYEKRPQLFSLQLVSPDIKNFRAEVVAGIQTRSQKQLKETETRTYRDQKWAHYAGALIEYYNPWVTVGFTFKRTFSKLIRSPLAGSDYEPDFGNWQSTNQYGFYASGDLFDRIRLEQWLWYENYKDRLQGASVPEGYTGFDFREERLRVKSRILYDNYKKGFKAGIEYHAEYQYPQTGPESYPRFYDSQDINQRLTFTAGYRINPNFYLIAGISYDADLDRYYNKTDNEQFDGCFGRLSVTW